MVASSGVGGAARKAAAASTVLAVGGAAVDSDNAAPVRARKRAEVSSVAGAKLSTGFPAATYSTNLLGS